LPGSRFRFAAIPGSAFDELNRVLGVGGSRSRITAFIASSPAASKSACENDSDLANISSSTTPKE